MSTEYTGGLAPAWYDLPDRERHVINVLINRLARGLEDYGPLKRGKKNWKREAFEEALDASVYIVNDMLDKAGYL